MITDHGTGFIIEYPPHIDWERHYTSNKLVYPNEDNQESHSLNLFFEKKPFKGYSRDILSVEISALKTLQQSRLDSMKLVIRMNYWYEDDKYLHAYLNSLGGEDIGSGFQFNYNFNSINSEDSKSAQEKAEALFLFLLANVGSQPINDIKNTIGFSGYFTATLDMPKYHDLAMDLHHMTVWRKHRRSMLNQLPQL